MSSSSDEKVHVTVRKGAKELFENAPEDNRKRDPQRIALIVALLLFTKPPTHTH